MQDDPASTKQPMQDDPASAEDLYDLWPRLFALYDCEQSGYADVDDVIAAMR